MNDFYNLESAWKDRLEYISQNFEKIEISASKKKNFGRLLRVPYIQRRICQFSGPCYSVTFKKIRYFMHCLFCPSGYVYVEKTAIQSLN